MSGNKRPLGVGVALALNGELGGVAAYWTHWLGHCVQRLGTTAGLGLN